MCFLSAIFINTFTGCSRADNDSNYQVYLKPNYNEGSIIISFVKSCIERFMNFKAVNI